MTVNMDNDQEDLYLNINILLKDICKFLENKTICLSPVEKKKAEVLIQRSKKQLQTIAKIITTKDLTKNNDNETEEYVDMNGKTVLSSRPTVVETEPCESICPFQDLPAKEATPEIKYGNLIKRSKMFNFLDRSTKVYAVIHGNWLLIYGSSKHLKPDCMLDLRNYEAKEDESDLTLSQLEIAKYDSLKKNSLNLRMALSFKVFHTASPDKKSYSFVATTHKDMLQWVVNINRRHNRAVLESKPVQEDRNYEVCQDLLESDPEENIYSEVEITPVSGPPVKPEAPIEDPLPAPKMLSNCTQSYTSQSHSSLESLVSYEEVEGKQSPKEACDKFSLNSFGTSEDEDQTYYELDTIKKDIEEVKKISEDIRESPNVPLPPEIAVDPEDENIPYENNLIRHRAKVHHNGSDSKTTVKSKSESASKPKVPERNVPKSLTPKPNIMNPMPWKPFAKTDWNKSPKLPKISKHKSIRETVKSPPQLEIKPLKGVSSLPPPVSNEFPKSTPKSCELGNIVRIIRKRLSNGQTPPCTLETFSKSSKVETIRTLSTKESPSSNFARSPNKDVNETSRSVDSLIADSCQDASDRDGNPMVLLKPSVECGESLKKGRKSPVVPVKPKKIAKKLAF